MKLNFLMIIILVTFAGCNNNNTAQTANEISPTPKVENESLRPPEIPTL